MGRGPELAGATGCSIGIALSGRDGSHSFLQEADTALYQAKKLGGDRWELYDHVIGTATRRSVGTEKMAG